MNENPPRPIRGGEDVLMAAHGHESLALIDVEIHPLGVRLSRLTIRRFRLGVVLVMSDVMLRRHPGLWPLHIAVVENSAVSNVAGSRHKAEVSYFDRLVDLKRQHDELSHHVV